MAGLLQLCPCLKYWGFSTTGMRVIPMTTASGPASRVQGVIIPWLTWWRGLAESSSPLITATGPGMKREGRWVKLALKSSDLYVTLVTYENMLKYNSTAWGIARVSHAVQLPLHLKRVCIIVTSVWCYSSTVQQHDICAELDTTGLFSHSSAEGGKYFICLQTRPEGIFN